MLFCRVYSSTILTQACEDNKKIRICYFVYVTICPLTWVIKGDITDLIYDKHTDMFSFHFEHESVIHVLFVTHDRSVQQLSLQYNMFVATDTCNYLCNKNGNKNNYMIVKDGIGTRGAYLKIFNRTLILSGVIKLLLLNL